MSAKAVRFQLSALISFHITRLDGNSTTDIQWLSVSGDKITVETQGKDKLREFMTEYFKSTPTAKSELEWVQVAGSRVAAKEQASWQGKAGLKTQSSLSIYEFRGELIARVYYYPVEK
jgi:hypothetical protein